MNLPLPSHDPNTPSADTHVAIVTGGAAGIGRALCLELGRRGTTVRVTDVDRIGAERVATEIGEAGGRALADTLDVTDADAVGALVDRVTGEHGRLDLMVNNAGIALVGEVRDLSVEQWRRVVDVNLMGVVHGTHAAYLVMVAQGSGHIVNVSSLAGLIGGTTLVPYATTKSAVVALSTSLRAEAAALGVRVSVTCPGFVETGIYGAAESGGTTPEHWAAGVTAPLISADRAAQLILRGVDRNRAVITFPFYARLLGWLCRLHPALVAPVHRRILGHVREGRTDD